MTLRSRASDSLDSMSAFSKSFRLGYRLATSVTSLSPDVPAQSSGKASALAPMLSVIGIEPGELMPAPLGPKFHLAAFDPDFRLKISIWPIVFGYFGAPAGNHDVSASFADSVHVAPDGSRITIASEIRRSSRSSSRSLN